MNTTQPSTPKASGILVSVLVPVHGVEAWVDACAESLFAQTYPYIEYVFVDDASPDCSVERILTVLERYPQRREQVRWIHLQTNQGVGFARETALQAANGEWVCFVDADDTLPLHAIEILVNQQRETGADLVDGVFDEIYSDGRSVRIRPFCGTEKAYITRLLARNTIRHNLWAKLYRKALFTENNLHFEPGIDVGEDFSMLARVAYFARRAVCHEPVYAYRIGENSHFTGKPSWKNAVSSVKSYGVPNRFYRRDRAHSRFDYAMQLGVLLCLINTVAGGILPLAQAEQLLGVPLTSVPLLAVRKLLKDNQSTTMAKLCYRMLKRIYLLLH